MPTYSLYSQKLSSQILYTRRMTRAVSKWLTLLLIVATLLPAQRVAAQSASDAPAETTAPVALYLPIAMAAAQAPESNPLTVEAVADASRAVTATIPVEGGTLAVTATNGTRYTLVIPADALLSEEEIVMTPLENVTGMPLRAGLVGGVQLGPDGLVLFKDATLTIEGTPAIDGALQTVGFGYQENGKEFHLRPVVVEGNRISVKLNHFSGYGVSAGTQQEILKQAADHAPTAPLDNANQIVVAGADETAKMREIYETDVLPDLLAGRDEDFVALERSLYQFPAWVEFAGWMGLQDDFADLIETGWKHLFLGVAHAVELKYVQCRDGDASQVVKVIRWVNLTRKLPAEQRRVWISDSYLNNDMRNMAIRCATFEMDFDSTVVQEFPGVPHVGQEHDSHLRAENVRVQFDLQGKLVAPTQAPLVYQSFNLAGAHPKCVNTTSTTNGTFNLTDARMNLNYGFGETPKITVNFDPGHPTEKIVQTCPLGVVLVYEPLFWNEGFWMVHWSELHISKQYFEFSNWNYVGNSLFADLIIERPIRADANYFGGTTWMVLAHAPE